MFREEYRKKKVSVEYALSLLHSGDLVVIGGYGNEPQGFLERLHTVGNELRQVKICSSAFPTNYPFLEDVSLAGRIDVVTFFSSPILRENRKKGRISDYIPNNLHDAGICLAAMKQKPRVCVIAVSPMDEDGYFCMSTSLMLAYEALNLADLVILEVNRKIPRTYGDTRLHISRVDYLYEEDHDMPGFPVYHYTQTDYQIAENAASMIRDGDTIQLGVGGVPGCMDAALLQRRDLGVHTEFFGDSMVHLMKKGVINNSKKTLNPRKSICAFVGGSPDLYSFIDNNPEVELRSIRYVNDPGVIAMNDNFVSVNTAIEVDLTGQICSESIGSQLYSGTGGAADFAAGAFHSRGGRGIIAMHATTKNNSVSKIKAQLTPGAAVSISRNLADTIVTEFGIARLRGASIRERALALISIAHPAFRADLRRQAEDLLLW